MADPVPTTRLEAINRMLATIGMTRVTTLLSEREDHNEAQAVLDEVTREVQKDGWSWNTDCEYPLTSVNDKFDIPSNALQVVFSRKLYPSSTCPGPRFVERTENGTRRVYDRDNHTFAIPDLDVIKADVTWAFEFEALPEAARWYILVRAARQFANIMMGGDPAIRGFTEQDEVEAKAKLKEAEGEVAQRSIFDSPFYARLYLRRL